MKHIFAGAALLLSAGAALADERPSQAVIDAYLAATFGKAPPEWQARIKPDESLAVCNTTRNSPSSAESEAMLKRESARVSYPADGKFLGDWKKGYQVANNGRGGQFSDAPNTVSGGNCFACHQLDPKEVSFGTLGPSLAAYGKDRKYDPETIKDAYTKIYNSMAVVPCSNMPRFGVNKVLDEQQIKDVMAYLFDPESPVNK
ncbi:sulfur oxidation c-type cytochrome SoxX [Bosea sp. (in: a-proteobacteria)]|uniref:sulfur oxidation c-type cytochrome SoxX n=1 Tax=Bosea sp. (in: a-proteobacteria) TaxID=1871050 RepID=UPI001ACF121C|nr:sulfur oxidation c-type cytochrome SoxX [Bosea sp. (in: a-proteobacteria)]MBN9436822.1 sulfur oxidation c-type cytochrome SoxX [Bosea sp. (in: a-proteobacteria)]